MNTEVFHFELLPNGILCSVWTGEAQVLDIARMREVAAHQHALRAAGSRLSFVDASAANGFSGAARGELNLIGKEKPWDYVALVGMPFGTQVAINLIMRALRLMKMDLADVRFFDTEEAGMAWLESKLGAV